MAKVFIDWGYRSSPMTKKRLAYDPRYAKVKGNAAEFGTACKAGKLLRSAFANTIKGVKDPRLSSRLQKLMLQVVKSDAWNVHGERRAGHGDLRLLEGFEFNGAVNFRDILGVDCHTAIDRSKGELVLSVPAFVPQYYLSNRGSATHYELIFAAANVDFAAERYNSLVSRSGLLKIGTALNRACTLRLKITPDSFLPLFLAAGINFSEVVNENVLPVGNGAFNALSLLKVDMV